MGAAAAAPPKKIASPPTEASEAFGISGASVVEAVVMRPSTAPTTDTLVAQLSPALHAAPAWTAPLSQSHRISGFSLPGFATFDFLPRRALFARFGVR